ncbi:MAG: hypothetical protein D6685_00760 [Bacteroidetes bacterium]|nr:MAG: hypothetical protein D6685_00760 [Bacteroidota bacterium]
MPSSLRYRVPVRLLFLLLLAAGGWPAAAGLQPARAQVQGLSYTLAPTAERVYWTDNAGLESGLLYGGQLGLGFGEFVELNGLYLAGRDFGTNFGAFSGLDPVYQELLAGLSARRVDVTRLGGDLKLNVPVGSLVPFLTLGTGLLRFDPENRGRSERIYLSGGAGLQFSLASRYTLTLAAENLTYRYNAGSMFFSDEDLQDLGLGPQNFNQVQVSNWAVRAALQFYLGGRERGAMTEVDQALRQQFERGLRGLTIPVEPFIGQVEFDASLPYQSSHRVAGVQAGLDFGSYVGVRGTYWQSLDSGTLAGAEDLRAYGGELRLNLGGDGAQSLNPFITLGGGYLDAGNAYVGRDSLAVSDAPYATGGAGIILPVSDRLRFRVMARALLMSNDDPEDISQPSDVKTSYMYSAGLTFALGGRSAQAGLPAGSPAAEATEAADGAADESPELRELRAELAASRARLDSLQALLERGGEPARTPATPPAAAQTPAATPARADTVRPATPPPTVVRPARGGQPQMVTLPVPQEGELYIRFGQPGGVSIESYFEETTGRPVGTPAQPRADTTQTAAVPAALPAGAGLTAAQIRQIVQETVRAELQQQRAAEPTSTVTAEELERQLRERLDQMEERLQERIRQQALELREAQARQAAIVQQTPPPVDVRVESPAGGASGGTAFLQHEGVRPYLGYGFGRGPDQFLLGVRWTYGTRISGPARFRLAFTLGFGQNETAINPSLGGVYPVRLEALAPVVPYAGLGLGLLTYNELATVDITYDVILGASVPFGPGDAYLEYNTLDLFDIHRFLAGYRIRF